MSVAMFIVGALQLGDTLPGRLFVSVAIVEFAKSWLLAKAD